MDNNFNLQPYVLAFVRRRKTIIIHFLLIAVVAWAYAFFLVKKEFKSQMVFLPPLGENSLSSIMPGISLPTATSSEIMAEQIGTIFISKSLQRKVIDKFDLIKHYKLNKNQNKFENTLKRLSKSLALEPDERGNLGFSKTISFLLVAYNTSPDTACRMVNFTFTLLDSAVKAISSGRAHRDRVFIEEQLVKNRAILDSLQKELQIYQLKNKAYDIPVQVQMSIKAYADIKSNMLANEIRIKAIHNEFEGQTPELASLQKSNLAFKEKLSQIESGETPDAMPSMVTSTKLLPQFTNLMRDVEVQNQVILFITRELEQAKIKEAKNISGLVVVDSAFVSEYKARPKRVPIMAVFIGVYMLFILCFITIQEMYRISFKNSEFFKAFWAIVKNRN
jgi:uncharacterized protein involved in exopolysaccharide biosynthesis